MVRDKGLEPNLCVLLRMNRLQVKTHGASVALFFHFRQLVIMVSNGLVKA